MRKGRDLDRQLDRLVAATGMFVIQQYERTALGTDEDYHDAKNESGQVVSEVLTVIERSLDEDLLERLDRGDYPKVASFARCGPRYSSWYSLLWPYGSHSPLWRGVRSAGTRRDEMLDHILEDFRTEFESRLKNARKEERSMTDAELDEMLTELKEDLSVVARRSRRREGRRLDEEEQES
jgi:hypothetical protein